MSSGTASLPASRPPVRPAIPDVLLQHLEEHGFLSLQRRRLQFSLELPLRRLAQHDERIEAHWDGMVVAGKAAVELAEEKLEGEDPWELATAARAWIVLGNRDADAVLSRLAALPPEKAASWREALRGLPEGALAPLLPEKRVPALPPHAFAVAIDALGWHGKLPRALAESAARHPEAGVRAAFARVAPHAGLDAPERMVQALFDDPDVAVRRRALWGAALIVRDAALERARRAARGSTPDAFAVRLLGLLGDAEDHAVLAAAAATDTGRPSAFWALGDLGTEDAVESLARLLTLPDDELREVVVAALEIAVGRVEREDLSAPPRSEEVRAHWATISGKLPRDARVMAGLARPWRGEASEERTLWHWRAAISGRKTTARWLRREVPDGFFEALPAEAVRPGE